MKTKRISKATKEYLEENKRLLLEQGAALAAGHKRRAAALGKEIVALRERYAAAKRG